MYQKICRNVNKKDIESKWKFVSVLGASSSRQMFGMQDTRKCSVVLHESILPAAGAVAAVAAEAARYVFHFET